MCQEVVTINLHGVAPQICQVESQLSQLHRFGYITQHTFDSDRSEARRSRELLVRDVLPALRERLRRPGEDT